MSISDSCPDCRDIFFSLLCLIGYFNGPNIFHGIRRLVTLYLALHLGRNGLVREVGPGILRSHPFQMGRSNLGLFEWRNSA